MARSKVSAWMAVSCAVAVVCGSAWAVPMAPGTQVNLGGTTTLQTTWLSGVTQGLTLSVPFGVQDAGGNLVFQGTLTSFAIRSNELGTLRFQYRLVNTQAVGSRRVVRVDLAGYQGFQTNVNYSTDGLGAVGPNTAARTANGSQVAFVFSNPTLPAGTDSRSFWLHTEATAYDANVLAQITLNTGETVVIGGLRGPALTDCPGDTNGDGVVNFTDLNTVLTNFGDDCN